MATAPQGKATITKMSPGSGVDANGKAQFGWRVEFKTARDLPGEVFVPGATIQPAAVRAAVKAQAAAIDELHGGVVE